MKHSPHPEFSALHALGAVASLRSKGSLRSPTRNCTGWLTRIWSESIPGTRWHAARLSEAGWLADEVVAGRGYAGFGGIWRVPVSGGPETLVLDKAISPHLWDLTDREIYFVDGNAKPVATGQFCTAQPINLAPT